MNFEKHDSITQTDFIDQNDSPFLFEFPTPMTIQQPAAATPIEQVQFPNPLEESEVIEIRRSHRVRKPPSYLKEFHCNSVLTDSSSYVTYPLSIVVSYDNISPQHMHFISSITINEEPKNYKQVVQHPHWVKTMNSELEALHQNKTWIITDLPVGKRPIGCKWVFKIKYNSDGSIERHKGRLVAKGYTQVEGIDFFDTFSPVAKLTTIRLLLSIASSQKWHLH